MLCRSVYCFKLLLLLKALASDFSLSEMSRIYMKSVVLLFCCRMLKIGWRNSWHIRQSCLVCWGLLLWLLTLFKNCEQLQNSNTTLLILDQLVIKQKQRKWLRKQITSPTFLVRQWQCSDELSSNKKRKSSILKNLRKQVYDTTRKAKNVIQQETSCITEKYRKIHLRTYFCTTAKDLKNDW